MKNKVFKTGLIIVIMSCIVLYNSNIILSVFAADNTFTVKYYLNDTETQSSNQTTLVNYGTETPTLTIRELGFYIKGKVFLGWRVYREIDQCWKFTNGNEEIWAKEKPNGYDYLLYVNGNIVAKTTAPGTVVRLYAQWIDANLDVTNEVFGANGQDKNDDALAIQKALNMAKDSKSKVTVNIPKGTYYISKALKIYSNTDLILDKDAVIIRQNDENMMLVSGTLAQEGTYGYNQINDVTVTGGVWDGNVTSFDSTGGTEISDLMLFMYGSNIVIKDMTIKECCGYHFIELVGMKDTKIENIIFSDYIKSSSIKEWNDEEASAASEAVQIDFDHLQEGTICSNVTVENCTFLNCMAGIGNHHSEQRSNNINILNNTFRNIEKYCVNLQVFDDVTIQKNQAENVGMFVNSEGSKDITVNNNTVNNITENAVYLVDSTAEISDNKFSNIKGSAAINILSNSVASILNNEISDLSRNGIRVKDGTGSTIIGNTISDIEKDGILIETSNDVTIKNNNILNSKNSLITLISSNNNKVLENILTDYSQNGVYCDNTTGEISENSIMSKEIKGQFGIIANKSNLQIKDNNISGLSYDGINANESQYIITNNSINNCDRYGIRIKYSKYSIKSNNVMNNGKNDICVYDTVEGEIIDNIIGTNGIAAPIGIVQRNNTTQSFTLGDVNQDGKIDSKDAVQVLKHVAHNIQLTDIQLLAADTNKDGEVNSKDAVQILKYVAHNISEF